MNISILGCGWLGFPLAERLLEAGHLVKGSTTSRDKIQSLHLRGIIPFHIKILEEGVQGDLSSFLSDADLLIINIPPGLRGDPEANFIGKMGRLMDHLGNSPVKNLLFVSATSVYEDKDNFPVYTEDDPANGTAVNSSQLISAENLFRSSESFTTTIIRFGGLFGPGRHPVQYLAGKKDISNPKAPVNLIHLEDCIGIISSIISKEAWGEINNAVYPEHPSREIYYSKIAEERNLAKPGFAENQISKGKIIESVNVGEKLDYTFAESIWEQ